LLMCILLSRPSVLVHFLFGLVHKTIVSLDLSMQHSAAMPLHLLISNWLITMWLTPFSHGQENRKILAHRWCGPRGRIPMVPKPAGRKCSRRRRVDATSAAAAPAIDPTQAIEFSIQAIGALNQPIYIFAAQFAITNTSSEDITVDGFQGTFYFPYQMGDYYQDTKPDSIGLLGTYTSPANVTVPANSTVMNWVQAVVPKTSAANFWLTMVADANAYATVHNAAKGYLTFSGTATIEGAQVPLNVKYL
jgi:hypothetical protein